MRRSTVLTPAATLLVLVAAATVDAASFGASVRSTRCNTDPNKGEVNNPCGSLYDAECGGEYCRCPLGTGVHPNLRRCMRGYDDDDNDDNGDNSQGSQSDLFDDLPFDYVPPGSKAGDTPQRPDVSTEVSDTRCGGSYDPCAARYGAMCSGGRCRCPPGTKHSPTVARCDPDPTYDRNQDHSEYDNGVDDYDDDDDSWFGGNSASSDTASVHIMSVAALGVLTGRWWAGPA